MSYINKRVYPTLDVVYTREAKDTSAMIPYHEATLPVGRMSDLDLEVAYAPHWAGIKLDNIVFGMDEETPGVVIVGDSDYSALQLASYIAAYNSLQWQEVLQHSRNPFEATDYRHNNLLAVCSLKNIFNALERDYAGYFIVDCFDESDSFVDVVLRDVFMSMQHKLFSKRVPILVYLKPCQEFNPECEQTIMNLCMGYHFNKVKVGVQTNAYLERLLLQRAHHAGVTVGQHFDADNAISILATYGYNSNEVEHKIDDLVGYANSKCPDKYVDTVESLHFTPSAKNIEAYNQFINDNYYDLYDYDMEDIDMMTNNAIFCDDGFGDAQASDFDGFFDEFEPVSFESVQESPSTDFEDLFDDWTDDFEYEAEDICVEDADTFDEFAAALVV